jgi:hypothetical protein
MAAGGERSFFTLDHIGNQPGSAGPSSPEERFIDHYGEGIVLGLAIMLFALLAVRQMRKYPHSNVAMSNLLLIAGIGLAVGTVLLTDLNYGDGVLDNILRGAEVLDTGLQARWPLLVSLILICWSLVRRFAVSRQGDEE